MHELLVNRFFKLAQEKVWLVELTIPPMTTADDWDVKQENKQKNIFLWKLLTLLCVLFVTTSIKGHKY